MKVNFGKVEDPKELDSLLPEGDYLCQLEKVVEGNSASGDAMWTLWWKIYQGDGEGRYIFDRIFFNEKCYPRMKMVLGRLGLNVSGELDLQSAMLVEKFALVTVKHKLQTQGKNAGKQKEEVPFHGYQSVEVTEEGDDDSDEPSF